MEEIIFYIFYAFAGLSALGILLIKDVFKAALLLLVCLLCVAALYVFAYAEFLSVTQILVYAGGVVVVIIFGIMLTTRVTGKSLKVGNTNVVIASLTGLAFFAVVVYATRASFPFDDGSGHSRDTIRETGFELMTSYVFPFELAGILLLAALIGAAVISNSTKRDT